MKLLAPISSPDEVLPLIRAGAEEIYCGVVPEAWQKREDPAHWLNRRSAKGANLQTLQELEQVVGTAHEQGVRVYLTLNAHHYTDRQIPGLVQLAREAAALAVDAFIVSDPSLVHALAQADVGADLHLSSLGVCLNSEAVRFWQALGVKRVILPRHLSLAEIEAIAGACPEVEFEVFLLNDGCIYEEGLCLTTHQWGAFCLEPWTYRMNPLTDRADEGAFQDALAEYRRFKWFANNCGCTVSPRGLPQGPCALCHLGVFARAGIASLKVVGREASPVRKLASVQLAGAVLATWRATEDDGATRARARDIRATPELCDAGYMCYFH